MFKSWESRADQLGLHIFKEPPQEEVDERNFITNYAEVAGVKDVDALVEEQHKDKLNNLDKAVASPFILENVPTKDLARAYTTTTKIVETDHDKYLREQRNLLRINAISEHISQEGLIEAIGENPQLGISLAASTDSDDPVKNSTNLLNYLTTIKRLEGKIKGINTLVRVGRDIGMQYAGGKMLKGAGYVKKVAGAILSSPGTGTAADYGMLGETTNQLQTRYYTWASKVFSDPLLTNEEKLKEYNKIADDIWNNVPGPYQSEVAEAILYRPDIFSDGGNLMGYLINGIAKGTGDIIGVASKKTTKAGNLAESLPHKDDMSQKIEDLLTNMETPVVQDMTQEQRVYDLNKEDIVGTIARQIDDAEYSSRALTTAAPRSVAVYQRPDFIMVGDSYSTGRDVIPINPVAYEFEKGIDEQILFGPFDRKALPYRTKVDDVFEESGDIYLVQRSTDWDNRLVIYKSQEEFNSYEDAAIDALVKDTQIVDYNGDALVQSNVEGRWKGNKVPYSYEAPYNGGRVIDSARVERSTLYNMLDVKDFEDNKKLSQYFMQAEGASLYVGRPVKPLRKVAKYTRTEGNKIKQVVVDTGTVIGYNPDTDKYFTVTATPVRGRGRHNNYVSKIGISKRKHKGDK